MTKTAPFRNSCEKWGELTQVAPVEALFLIGDADPGGGAVEGGGEGGSGQRRGVVVLAEVGGDEVLQLAGVEGREQGGGSGVFEMAEASGDAALEVRRIVALTQHGLVIIAFEHQRVAAGQHPFDMGRCAAKIGRHAEAAPAIGKNELDGFGRVVGNGKGMDFEIADGERLVAVDEFELRQFAAPGQCRGERAVRDPDGKLVAGGETDDAADVVAVLVGDDDAGEGFRLAAEAGQPEARFARAEAAIEQEPRRTGFDEQGIAAAAAAQRGEAHYFNWS